MEKWAKNDHKADGKMGKKNDHKNLWVFFVRLNFVTLVRKHAAENLGFAWAPALEHESRLYDPGWAPAHCIFPGLDT
jgi:hypothetical protein